MVSPVLKQKGRVTADSAFSSVIFSVTKCCLGRVTIFPDSKDFLIALDGFVVFLTF